jgi:DNA-binding NtrC family response regulator
MQADSLEIEETSCLTEDSARRTEDFRLLIVVCNGDVDKQLVDDVPSCAPDTPFFVVAQHSSEELAIRALKAGARDYFRMPLAYSEFLAAIQRVLSEAVKSAIVKPISFSNRPSRDMQPIVGQSKAMLDVITYARRVAASDCNVLITGETGTGKELVAETIHRHSSRRRLSFVCVNCAAIPDTLLESELFGYERGAFTGADCRSTGKVAGAEGGTVFLDEIGEMTAYAQAKILRVIECKEIQRLGSRNSFPVNVRVVAATNKNLESLVASNSFRADLYFRLNVVSVHMVPLRERKEDIACLLHYFIQVLNRKYCQHVYSVSNEAINQLLQYDWPGNIRELKNVLESIYVRSERTQIEVEDLPNYILRFNPHDVHVSENERLTRTLEQCNWNKSKVANQLKWSRMTVYRKMALYGIRRNCIKPADSTREPLSQPKAS